MSERSIVVFESLVRGRKKAVKRSSRFILEELIFEGLREHPIPLARDVDDVRAIHELIGGDRREIRRAIDVDLVCAGDEAIAFEGESPNRVLRILAFDRYVPDDAEVAEPVSLPLPGFEPRAAAPEAPLSDDEARLARKRASAAERQRRLRLKRHLHIFERDGFQCVYCGSTENLSIDHKVPTSRDGTDDDSNLVVACGACNSSKNARTPQEWAKSELAMMRAQAGRVGGLRSAAARASKLAAAVSALEAKSRGAGEANVTAKRDLLERDLLEASVTRAPPSPSPSGSVLCSSSEEKEDEYLGGSECARAGGREGVTRSEATKQIVPTPIALRSALQRASRLSPSWSPSPETVAFALELGFDAAELLPEFRDHWLAEPKAKLDWDCVFRNRVRYLADQRGERAARSQRARDSGFFPTARETIHQGPNPKAPWLQPGYGEDDDAVAG